MPDTTERTAAHFRSGTQSTGLLHAYEPWSSGAPGLPPAGAVALCGHVRENGAPGRICGPWDPDACVVCMALHTARRNDSR